ncbi:major facilitator superfamily domain-containing protein [Protomyces lactucae-debilis]|uniref:Major facilitator superfamily domain-containing protein n=1 Tax=Protomyces lactucae-debilis TaxID=2754530 RepID=A0A1Y2FG10_PROLT|nr:major facilitator superfamily domain-containing protein [Protomyces lactucae-debilis]ORY82557.1 major facilitator superfamily domain-containing protein [Protomyces lactucae-debilis]
MASDSRSSTEEKPGRKINTKESAPSDGHGGAILRDSAFGMIARNIGLRKLFPYNDERPEKHEYYKHAYAQDRHEKMKHDVIERNQEEEQSWRRENPQDAATEDRRVAQGLRTRSSSAEDAATLADEAPLAQDRIKPGAELTDADDTSSHGPLEHRPAHHDTERGKDVNLVTFEENDPENPLNWSTGKKSFVTAMLCLLTISIYMGSAIYSPGVKSVMSDFTVNSAVGVLPLSSFVLGYGLGPVLWAPMSEVPVIGRNPVYIGTLIVFVALQVPTALAPNIGSLIVTRFLGGFFGSPVLATGGASIGDMFMPKYRATPIAIFGAAAVCGPSLGPMIGGFIVDWGTSWRWTIWELLWLSGFGLAVLFFFLPETSGDCILLWKAKRLRKLTGNNNLQSEGEIKQKQMTFSQVASMSLLQPITLTVRDPMVFLLGLYISIVYGILYIFLESFPIVYGEMYGFNNGEVGLTFLGLFVGAVLAIIGYEIYVVKKLHKEFDNSPDGTIEPERRLVVAMVGCFGPPICLFWFAWTANPRFHWAISVASTVFYGAGTILLFQAILNFINDYGGKRAASLLAGNDMMRSSFACGFPVFAGAMMRNLGIGRANTVLGGLSVAMIPLPFLFFKFGKRLRRQ